MGKWGSMSMNKDEKLNFKEWVKGLKVGERVAYESDSRYGISVIEKITPTGRINLKCGLTFTSEGETYGSGYVKGYLTPEIDRIENKLKRARLLRTVGKKLESNLPYLSIEALQEIEKLLMRHERRE